MTDKVTYEIGNYPEVAELCALREAVGWDRAELDYPAVFDAYDTCITARADDGTLIGWCAVLSDGKRHAFLLDVIVAPEWQHRGVGQSIVDQAIRSLKQRHFSIVHVDFQSDYEQFYQKCGFQPSSAGILRLESYKLR